MTIFSNKKKYIWSIISLLVLVGLAVVLFFYQKTVPAVDIEIFGTSIDPAFNSLEKMMKNVAADFSGQVKIVFNYVCVKDENNNFKSLSSSSDSVPAESQNYDVAENKRRLVIQKYYPDFFWNYLAYREFSNDYDWSKDAYAAGLDVKKITDLVNKEGNELLATVNEKSKNLVADNQEVAQLPVVLINNELYRGNFDVLSLQTAVAQKILRHGQASLSEQNNRVEFFKGVISFKSPWQKLSVNGINECYNDSHCLDKKDMDGTCYKALTDEARCVYTEPAKITLDIIVNRSHDINNDVIVANLQAENKGLTVNLHRNDDPSVKTIINQLTLTEFPVYVFNDMITKSRYWLYYEQQKFIIKQNNYYIFNPDLIAKFLPDAQLKP